MKYRHYTNNGVLSVIACFDKYVEFRTEWSLNIREMNRPSPLIFFAICAVVDFVFGYIKWHTVGSGIVAIICGLPLTGFLFLCFIHLRKATTSLVLPVARGFGVVGEMACLRQ